MVRPTSKSRLRSTNSISGKPFDTLDQASDVGRSRSVTQPAGTASCGAVSASRGTSSPDIIEYAVATAAMFGPIGPSVSSDLLNGITPEMSMLPNAGLKPATPQSEAGFAIPSAAPPTLADSPRAFP